MRRRERILSDIILKVEHLKKKYILERTFLGKEKVVLDAVDDVSFSIKKGESFALVGESGCGKSTTARSILKLIEADGGKVIFGDKTLFDVENKQAISNKDMSSLRKDMQIIFQDPYGSLDKKMKIGQIVSEGIEKHKLAYGKDALNMAEEYLKVCGIDKEALGRYPHEFSGGQRQRIGIARALAVKPKFVVADEPVAALDVSIQAQIINLLNELKKRYSLTFLFISHDLGVVKYFCDRIAVMYLGSIVELANGKDLFENPMHPYTRMLLESIPVSHPRLRKQRLNLEVEESEISQENRKAGCKFYNRCSYARECCRHEAPVIKEVSNGHFLACHLYD